MKKSVVFAIALIMILFQGQNIQASNSTVYVIDAKMNAQSHNNMGLQYMEERMYAQAIKEFEIAIQLNPTTEASAVFYYNLGRAYEKVHAVNAAQQCYERSIELAPLSFDYYKALVQTFAMQDILSSKLDFYSKRTQNPLNKIIVGLIYGANGDYASEITILDDFVVGEPDLLITNSIKRYIKEETLYNKAIDVPTVIKDVKLKPLKE